MGRILIACDEPQMRRRLWSNLLHDGHSLAQVKDAAEARIRISSDDYDCVFVDVELPGAVDFELILAALMPTPATSLLLVAPSSSLEATVTRLGQTAFQVLTEPFLPAQIRAAARRACERSTLVRENAAFKAVLLGIEQQIRQLPSRAADGGADDGGIATETLSAQNAPANKKQDHVSKPLGPAGDSFNLSGVLDQIEKELIERVLSQAGGLQAEAARRMGLSRSALAYKLHKHRIRLSSPQSLA